MDVMNRRAQLFCAWCGPFFVSMFIIGAALLGGYLPPMLTVTDTPAEFAAKVAEHQSSVRMGAFFMTLAVAPMAAWAASMAAQTRRREGRSPVLSYGQLTASSAAVACALLMATSWGLMGFRADEPGVGLLTQYFADLSYFIVLFTWPIFMVWNVMIALAILLDDSPNPIYPRWVGYANIFFGLSYTPSGLMVFFKTGPFSWTGILGLWVPWISFGIWILLMSFLTIRNIKNGAVDVVKPREELVG